MTFYFRTNENNVQIHHITITKLEKSHKKLHLASVFIYPYFQEVILSDQCSYRFLWTWLSCRT